MHTPTSPFRLPALFCAVVLLLAQALHAQSPFPLPRGGLALFANSGQPVPTLAQYENVVEVTPTYALLADGKLLRLADGTVALTGIVSILETKYGYFFAVHADGRLFIPVGADLVASNDVMDAVSVQAADPSFIESLTCVVFRAGGKVARYLGDRTVRPFPDNGTAPFSGQLAPKGSHLTIPAVGPSTPGTGYKVVGSVLQRTRLAEVGFMKQVLSIWDATEAGVGRSPVVIVKKAAVTMAEGSVPKLSKSASAGAASQVFFGRQMVTAQQTPRVLRVINEGYGTLTIGTVTVDGDAAGDFGGYTALSGSSLAAGEDKPLSLIFTPSAEGQRSAVLHIPTNDPEHPSFDLDLTGVGSLTPNSLPATTDDHVFAPIAGSVILTKLLHNDSSFDGDPLKIVSVTAIPGVTTGTVTLDPVTGFVTYHAASFASSTDAFLYAVSDGTDTHGGRVEVTLVDPLRLAAGRTFRGEEAGDSATVTFSMLTRRFAAARALRVGSPATLPATVSARLRGQALRGRVAFNTADNGSLAVLTGQPVAFEITVDEDGNALLFADGLKLRRDTYDRRHPVPREVAGSYTMSLPGAALDRALFPDFAVGDSVAAIAVARTGAVLIRGFMADGRRFLGSARLSQGNVVAFSLPLAYPSAPGGRFSGELFFDRTNPAGSLTGTATWVKPAGDRVVNLVTGFSATGRVIGSAYKPADLPASLRVRFNFGLDTTYTDFLATASGAFAPLPVFVGETTPVPFTPNVDPGSPIIPIFPATVSNSFKLVGAFARGHGLIIARRLGNQFFGPSLMSGVILQEQGKIVGSATFLEGSFENFSLFPLGNYTAPVTGAFVP